MTDPYEELSARERQIMDAVHRMREPTVAEIRAELPDPPTESAVRTMLMRLEEKGLLEHRIKGRLNRYRARRSEEAVRESALRRVMRTFFEDSPVNTVAAILDHAAPELSEEELRRLEDLVHQAREGR